MRRTFFYAVFVTIVAGSLATSCESKEKKTEDAQEKVEDATQELKEAQRELNSEYWNFKAEAEAKIVDNERQIAELRVKLNEPGKGALDGVRKNRIDALEGRNADLRKRLYSYETERSDWEGFKREFNHDMETLGEAFKDLGRNNKK